MTSEGIIKEITTLSLSDMIRVQQFINERCEQVKRENPTSFASVKWAVNNPEKAREKNRIPSQLHRD